MSEENYTQVWDYSYDGTNAQTEQKPEFIPVWDYNYDGLTAQSANKPKVFYKEPSIAGLYISAQPLECEKKMCNIL